MLFAGQVTLTNGSCTFETECLTMTDRIFSLSTERTDLQLTMTSSAMEDFRREGLRDMDEHLTRMVGQIDPLKNTAISFLDMVGEIMLDGVATGDTHTVILCAQWLFHHHPDVCGMASNGPKFQFLYNETTIAPHEDLACA